MVRIKLLRLILLFGTIGHRLLVLATEYIGLGTSLNLNTEAAPHESGCEEKISKFLSIEWWYNF